MSARERVALVTGSSRGIGAAIARALSRAGARVVVSYRDREDLAREVAEEIDSPMVLRIDVADRESVRRGISSVTANLGGLDILVNNAAISRETPFDQITDDDWDLVMRANLRGPFMCAQEALPGMVERGWGRIVNISSIGGQWGGVNQVHYAASKGGLIALTRSLARICATHDITVNAVAPGLVETDMTAREIASREGQDKIECIPLRRAGQAEEVAAAIVFLASEEASYVTGQTISVNGGMLFT